MTRIIKTYNGSTFVPRATKVWDGTSWVERQVRWWDGTEWQPALPWELTVRTGALSTQRDFTINFSTGSNLQIGWGDGTSQDVTSGTSITKTYPATNTDYTVRLKGSIGSEGRIWFTGAASITETSVISTISGITNFSQTFWGNSLTSIPAGLFDNTPNVTSFYQTFQHNPLTSIPAGLFDNTPNVTNFGSAFQGNSLTSLPAGLFDHTPNVVSFNSTFRNTTLTSIPAGLFDYTPNVTSFYATFHSCTDLEGEAPPLWEMFPNADGRQCFRSCTGLSNYSQIPSGWK